jgi:transcriptional regulator with PAS, ATPase and Fis domain
MNDIGWATDFPGSITVCDLQGIVLEMNEKAAEIYERYGGKKLIGKSLMPCHPELAQSRLHRLLETGESNVYTTEKNGIKKIIYQAPWYRDGQRMGMVELALEIPLNPPHFIRLSSSIGD